MTDLVKRSSTARIFSIIVFLGILPAWFFYIGVKYKETIQILEDVQHMNEEIYIPH